MKLVNPARMRGLRFASGAVAISALLMLTFTPLALVSPMACAGGCDAMTEKAIGIVFFSPLFFLLSGISGFVASGRPSRLALALTFLPFAVAMSGWLFSGILIELIRSP